ncbi:MULTISPECIES: 3-hydroxyacyl-CoA dehydrogenase/enoyl-CoA hydratase family protein [unclassified Achromobacter]|uniref:3-hydroxyacyl-CoA dehydrogenase/enoyl-CoA hydratase family protein n=1 Tax=unclassified Achromobacter TaxID=2626865 RepID=UPI000B519188|nr:MULTISPECIES: 3-hydroxyacyl-CoA dehydrogenase/enoyl-CoA hydratase family protein [unclassified Achromobacter]OWT74977.1 3-hydroxyacyl-CoA dehydrogenase [Achromobacter sp. HZ28]OWT76585.1 3-hydroxyacyl-CoA dehydrogenase [Achromobacter sp. HZ34]
METSKHPTVEEVTLTPTARIRKVAVLGAGVMGAQIAAHCVNSSVPVLLYDLPAEGADRSAIARKAVAGLAKLNPAPLALPALAQHIEPLNYDEHLDRLHECDLVIEAIAERLDWKEQLYRLILPALAPHATLASNTSGLSLSSLAASLPADIQPRFCGVHFFNPPRYMPLVELIPGPLTAPELLDDLETFLVADLGKRVVRAKDTPNFVGNRVGVFGIMAAMIEADRHGLTYDMVDELTGKRLGRAKSGTFRTADVVGLDTLAHVMRTMQDGLPDDPFHPTFATPPVLAELLRNGALGQKTGAGFYRKAGKAILRLDPASRDYVPIDAQLDDRVAAALSQRDPARRLQDLHACDHPQARFVWALLRDTFHYAAVHLADIAETARDLDQAMRWGFGHAQGPFEVWQAAGWLQVARWIQEDIDSGAALAATPLPSWVLEGPVAEAGGVHTPEGSWNPTLGQFQPRRMLAVYATHLAPPLLVGEARAGAAKLAAHSSTASTAPAKSPALAAAVMALGDTVYEDTDIRLWTAFEPGRADILVASFKTKMHTISPTVTAGILRAIDLAEANYRGLVIWQDGEPFSAGADLQSMLQAYMQGGAATIEPMERELQRVAQRMRNAQVPTVVALAGLALGGGCEISVHASARVAHMETYIGLVEVGVGLVPGAGGLAYCARRAAELRAASAPDAPLLWFVQKFAQAVATAQVSRSALDAREIGYLRESDLIVPHPDALLYAALQQAGALADAGWRPPLQQPFPVAGRDGIATLTAQLVNMRDGGFISAYDYELGLAVAQVICGGDVDAGSLVDEEWMLAQERRAFLRLLGQPKTQERIAGLLKTGKPVRN